MVVMDLSMLWIKIVLLILFNLDFISCQTTSSTSTTSTSISTSSISTSISTSTSSTSSPTDSSSSEDGKCSNISSGLCKHTQISACACIGCCPEVKTTITQFITTVSTQLCTLTYLRSITFTSTVRETDYSTSLVVSTSNLFLTDTTVSIFLTTKTMTFTIQSPLTRSFKSVHTISIPSVSLRTVTARTTTSTTRSRTITTFNTSTVIFQSVRRTTTTQTDTSISTITGTVSITVSTSVSTTFLPGTTVTISMTSVIVVSDLILTFTNTSTFTQLNLQTVSVNLSLTESIGFGPPTTTITDSFTQSITPPNSIVVTGPSLDIFSETVTLTFSRITIV